MNHLTLLMYCNCAYSNIANTATLSITKILTAWNVIIYSLYLIFVCIVTDDIVFTLSVSIIVIAL